MDQANLLCSYIWRDLKASKAHNKSKKKKENKIDEQTLDTRLALCQLNYVANYFFLCMSKYRAMSKKRDWFGDENLLLLETPQKKV